jgi:hypothetical protein
MKRWKGVFPVGMALALLMTAACARGVSQTEYDKVKTDLAAAQASLQSLQNDYNSATADRDQVKVDLATAQARVQSLQNDYNSATADGDKARADLATAQARVQSLQNDYNSTMADRDKARADLATAQARAQKLEGDLNLAQAQAKDLQTQLGSTKTSLDTTKADMQKLQGLLTTAQNYTKIADLLFTDSYKQQLGLESKYQYTESKLQAEVTKAAEATNDPILKALWDATLLEGQADSFGVVMLIYQPIALNSIFNGEGIPVVFPPATTVVTPSPTGQTILQIKLVSTDGKPVSSVEVGLWREVTPPTPPDAGVATTDASGIGSFTVKGGLYWIDFNPDDPPAAFTLPSGRMVSVVAGMVTQVEIPVFSA